LWTIKIIRWKPNFCSLESNSSTFFEQLFCHYIYTDLSLWTRCHQNQHQSLFVFTIKVSHRFIGETDCTKFLALAVLRFAPMGWWNWPLMGVNHIPSRQGCVLSLVHLKHRSLASTEKMEKNRFYLSHTKDYKHRAIRAK